MGYKFKKPTTLVDFTPAGYLDKATGSHVGGAIGKLDPLGYKEDKIKEQDMERGLDKAEAGWDGIEKPTYKNVTLERPKYVGDVEYGKLDAVLQGPSAMNNVSTDPRLAAAQMQALQSLQDVASNGGMTAEDNANLSRIQSQSAQADKGRRDAILQNMQARGMGGSGNELLAQLQSSQAATDRQSQAGLDVAGMAQSRALQAMQQQGAMAGDIRGQEWGEKSQQALATDQINQFNTGTQNDVTKTKVAGDFSADVQNQNVKQGTHNLGTDVTNKQIMHNNYTLPSKTFDDAVTIHSGKSGITTAKTDFAGDSLAASQADRGAIYNVGGTVAAAGISASDRTLKKDIRPVKEVDIEEFLSSFSPKKYKYKKEEHGKGDFTGVMAQDLKKSKLGKDMVVKDEEGKLGYDTQKMQGVQLAAIKFLADKLKDTK